MSLRYGLSPFQVGHSGDSYGTPLLPLRPETSINMRFTTKIIALVLAATMAATGCGNEDENPPPPENSEGRVVGFGTAHMQLSPYLVVAWENGNLQEVNSHKVDGQYEVTVCFLEGKYTYGECP